MPSGEINRFELNKDLHEFVRRMNCKAYFRKYGEGNLDRKDMRFKCKSKWMPDVVDPALSLSLENLERRILSINEGGRNYSNLDKEGRMTLKDLKSYEDIVIKSADKGSAVVVWGREDYCREASEQLTDELVYDRVNDNPLGRVTTLIDEKLRELVGAGKITEENRRYLKGKNVVLGHFYLLPTIHKRVMNVPGRPVVSNCGTATEEISEFVDFHLQPVVSCCLMLLKIQPIFS